MTSIGGIILAAGASSRMGSPKALLRMPDGRPLAAYQADLLARAGCAPVVIVLGADAQTIARALPGRLLAVNEHWTSGRLSSLQAGLRALPACAAYVVLPVDTVGVSDRTLVQLVSRAKQRTAAVLRPTHQGQPGRLVWLNAQVAEELQGRRPTDLPLDTFLESRTELLAVDDAAILNNVNTPEEWKRLSLQHGREPLQR